MPLKLPPPDIPDPKYLELVRKVQQKTGDGRLHWERVPTGMFAIVPAPNAPLVLRFNRSTPGSAMEGWASFILTKGSTNLLTVTNRPNTIAILLGGPDPMRDAVGELFREVEKVAKGDVDRAIDAVDEL